MPFGIALEKNARVALIIAAWLTVASSASAAERAEMKEEATDGRVFKVGVQLSVAGKVYAQPGPDKALKLQAAGQFNYQERRLAGTGRDAESLRTIRYYDKAAAAIQAGDQNSRPELRDSLRLIVAQGQTEGVEVFSPSGPLTYNELDLLRTPGDSLAALALLPEDRVEVGEIWKPAEWVLPLLTGVEAAEKSQLTCKLESIKSGTAQVTFKGETLGAILGAAASINVEGHYLWDLEQKHLKHLELTQTEKRTIGTVSPGLDVTAKVIVTREVIAKPMRFSDTEIAQIPLEPNDASRLLMFDSPAWNVRFFHDRKWHLFHQTGDIAVLRLLDKGGLITQCNIKKLPDAEPGKHVPEETFRADIQRTLGKGFQEIIQAEQIKLRDGLYVYRVIAVGTLERKNDKKEIEAAPMQWIYYLVANPEGRQIAFVFTLDPKLSADLKSRDLSTVGGIEFLPAKGKPTPISRSK